MNYLLNQIVLWHTSCHLQQSNEHIAPHMQLLPHMFCMWRDDLMIYNDIALLVHLGVLEIFMQTQFILCTCLIYFLASSILILNLLNVFKHNVEDASYKDGSCCLLILPHSTSNCIGLLYKTLFQRFMCFFDKRTYLSLEYVIFHSKYCQIYHLHLNELKH